MQLSLFLSALIKAKGKIFLEIKLRSIISLCVRPLISHDISLVWLLFMGFKVTHHIHLDVPKLSPTVLYSEYDE